MEKCSKPLPRKIKKWSNSIKKMTDLQKQGDELKQLMLRTK
jgi:hypothetical protein